MSDLGFRYVAGALSLDFVNTVEWRGTTAPRELLRDYGDLLRWAAGAGLLRGPEVKRLRRQAARYPDEGKAAYAAALEERSALYEVFSAVALGRRAPSAGLDTLNRALAKADAGPYVARIGRAYRWQWRSPTRGGDLILGAVARSAAELLVALERHPLRICSGEGCGWLFIDLSRSRSRRWCDMRDCGNRAKARRHYARGRGARVARDRTRAKKTGHPFGRRRGATRANAS